MTKLNPQRWIKKYKPLEGKSVMVNFGGKDLHFIQSLYFVGFNTMGNLVVVGDDRFPFFVKEMPGHGNFSIRPATRKERIEWNLEIDWDNKKPE